PGILLPRLQVVLESEVGRQSHCLLAPEAYDEEERHGCDEQCNEHNHRWNRKQPAAQFCWECGGSSRLLRQGLARADVDRLLPAHIGQARRPLIYSAVPGEHRERMKPTAPGAAA